MFVAVYIDVGCRRHLIVKSHGKEDGVDADGSKDEVLKEGTGDKCPNLVQQMIQTKHFHRAQEARRMDLVLNGVAGNEHLRRVSA